MSQQESTLRQLVKSRKFWVTTAIIGSVSLIFYDWYNDRYASPSTRYSRIEGDYQISVKKLRKIRKAFVHEMNIGLKEDDNLPQTQKQSSLKMLSTNVRSIPNGTEKGIFYTLDWGGSNYRVLRIEFNGKGSKPSTKEYKHAIEAKYQKCDDAQTLFDHLSQILKNQIIDHKSLNKKQEESNKAYPIGFTFSFPVTQPQLNQGILLEWTKGFDIPGVVGHDVVDLMHDAFTRNKINAKIHAVCNDTVGTLLACAYDYDNVRVGLILGTGTNACYIEPNPPNNGSDDEKKDDKESMGEIINIEWGNFAKLLPRMPTDFIMDEYTPNPGVQFAEKMMSGYYLGELVRLLSIEVFREHITNYGESTPLNFPWKFKSETVSAILAAYYNDNDIDGILKILRGEKVGLSKFTKTDATIFAKVCELIINRSADLSATLLLGTLEKTGLFTCHREDDRNPFEEDRFELTQQYKENSKLLVTVGIDGSVYQYVPKYKEKMQQCMERVVGSQIAQRVRLVHSSDGSGKGAALAVAASINN